MYNINILDVHSSACEDALSWLGQDPEPVRERGGFVVQFSTTSMEIWVALQEWKGRLPERVPGGVEIKEIYEKEHLEGGFFLFQIHAPDQPKNIHPCFIAVCTILLSWGIAPSKATLAPA